MNPDDVLLSAAASSPSDPTDLFSMRKITIDFSIVNNQSYFPVLVDPRTAYSNLKDCRPSHISYYKFGVSLHKTKDFIDDYLHLHSGRRGTGIVPLQIDPHAMFQTSHVLVASLKSDVLPNGKYVFRSRQRVYMAFAVVIHHIRSGQEVINDPGMTLDPKELDISEVSINLANGTGTVRGRMPTSSLVHEETHQDVLDSIKLFIDPLFEEYGKVMKNLGPKIYGSPAGRAELLKIWNTYFTKLGMTSEVARPFMNEFAELIAAMGSPEYHTNPSMVTHLMSENLQYVEKHPVLGPIRFESQRDYDNRLFTNSGKKNIALFQRYADLRYSELYAFNTSDRLKMGTRIDVLWAPDFFPLDDQHDKDLLSNEVPTLKAAWNRVWDAWSTMHANDPIIDMEREQAEERLIARMNGEDV